MRLFFAELSLDQPERLSRHEGAGVRDALAVANLLGLEVALRREHCLGAADELLHQLLGADSFLGDRQGGDVSGWVEGQEDVESVELGVDEPGLVYKRRAAGNVGEDDGLSAADRAGDPAQADLELGHVHQWNERLQRLEPRHRGGPNRKVRLDRLDVPQAQGQRVRQSDGPARRGACWRRER